MGYPITPQAWEAIIKVIFAFLIIAGLAYRLRRAWKVDDQYGPQTGELPELGTYGQPRCPLGSQPKED